MSGMLDTANYQTVWNDNFTQDQSINTDLFTKRWGNSSEFAFGGNGLTLTSDGTSAGLLTPDGGGADSYGYGLYQATFTMPANQSAGAYISLWPASDNWPGPEIDLAEQMNGKPYLTVHWQSGGHDQYQSFVFNADVSQPTTVAVDWESGGLTFYVNGREVVRYPSGGSVPVPKDAAGGGQNEAFGVGNSGPAGTSVTVSDLSYSKPSGDAGTTISSAITSQTTSVSGATFPSTGSASGFNNQMLSTNPGTDILTGNGGIDTFSVDATGPDGWAEIDNFHGGDVLNVLGFAQGTSTITWTTSTDPNGQSGATADISLKGDGHTDAAITFAGTGLSTAEGFASGNWHTSSGTPYLSIWKV